MTPEEILAGLDPEQRAAAEAVNGPVVILAGAGTGKTRAITHRMAYAVATGQHDARRSMALTFTVRAAGEMRARLAALGTDVTARTFHAAALAQVRHFWGRSVGGALPHLVPTKAKHVGRAAAAVGLASDPASVRDLAGEVEWAKVSNVAPDDYGQAVERVGRVAPASTAQVAALLAEYDRLLAADGAMDFEDVLRYAVAILDDSPLIRDEVRAAYRWFTVDEYQDVNPLQRRLLSLWLGDRDDLCVVGDAAQTIYTFAGATPEYLLGFREDFPNATEVRLVHSYRCSPEVVALANRVIAASHAPSSLVLTTTNPSGPVPRIVEHSDDQAEARFIAGEIVGLIDAGMAPRDIAVLYRINASSEPIEEALGERGVASAVRGSERYFDRPEVRQAITLLRGAARSGAPGEGPLPEQVEAVLASMGYSPERPAGTGAIVERWANLQRLVTLAGDLRDADLGALVADLDRRAELAHVPDAEAVTLASLHAAKGLEWRAVFIAGANEGALPIVHATTPEAIEEERRLLYVGITRARERLTITWSHGRAAWGGRSRSRFLDDLRDPAEASVSVVVAGGPARGERRRRGPARCRICGSALVTAPERTMGRCRACPEDIDIELLERLKAWRLEESRRRDVPAYVVFTDATLRALAEVRPTDAEGLSAIPGIGPAKLAEYSEPLLAVIARGD